MSKNSFWSTVGEVFAAVGEARITTLNRREELIRSIEAFNRDARAYGVETIDVSTPNGCNSRPVVKQDDRAHFACSQTAQKYLENLGWTKLDSSTYMNHNGMVATIEVDRTKYDYVIKFSK